MEQEQLDQMSNLEMVQMMEQLGRELARSNRSNVGQQHLAHSVINVLRYLNLEFQDNN